MKKVKFKIVQSNDGYTAIAKTNEYSIITEADTIEDLVTNILDATACSFEIETIDVEINMSVKFGESTICIL